MSLKAEQIEKQKGAKITPHLIGIFLISPFFTLLAALRNYSSHWAKNGVWLFVIFYGLVFHVDLDGASDSGYYASELLRMHGENWQIKDIISILTLSYGQADVYQPLITYIVAFFTDNYHVLFAIFGLILGYFYSRNIWLLIEENERKFDFVSIFLILLFAFIIHIGDGINGHRMWLATHVFVFGILNFFKSNDKAYLAVIASTFLIHFSFLVPLLLLIFFLLFEKRLNIYFVYAIFALSFVVDLFDFQTVRPWLSYLPKVYVEQAYGYVTEAVAEQQKADTDKTQQEVPWFLWMGKVGFKYGILILTSYFVFLNKYFIKKQFLNNYLIYGMLLFSIANVISFVPSAGRFLSVSAIILFAAYFILYQSSKPKGFKRLFFILSPLLLIFLLFKFRMFLEYPSIFLLIGNPLTSLYYLGEQGIYSLIESIF